MKVVSVSEGEECEPLGKLQAEDEQEVSVQAHISMVSDDDLDEIDRILTERSEERKAEIRQRVVREFGLEAAINNIAIGPDTPFTNKELMEHQLEIEREQEIEKLAQSMKRKAWETGWAEYFMNKARYEWMR